MYSLKIEQLTRAMMQKLLADYKLLDNKVKLLGAVPRKQLALFYQLADLALVPSLYEPFGYVAVEPMAAGVPVVAADAVGLAEIIEHDRTGLLVPVHTDAAGLRRVDVDHLAAAPVADRSRACPAARPGRSRARDPDV